MLGLYFVMNGERLTVPSSFVVEVLPAVELDPAGPVANGAAVQGLFRHRGQVVPLIDPTGSASKWEPRLSRRIIVVEATLLAESTPRRVGLSADRVLDLRTMLLEGRPYASSNDVDDCGAAFADAEGIVRRIDVLALIRRVFSGEAG